MEPSVFFYDRCDHALDAFERNVVRIIEEDMQVWAIIEEPYFPERLEVQSTMSSDKAARYVVTKEFPYSNSLFIGQTDMSPRVRIDSALLEGHR